MIGLKLVLDVTLKDEISMVFIECQHDKAVISAEHPVYLNVSGA